MYNDDKFRARIQQEIETRQLVSVMNNTKWRQFYDAMESEEMPFSPAYRRKDLLDEEYIPFTEDVDCLGDYYNDIPNFMIIEFIEVRPRRLVHRGRLVESDVESVEEEFLAVLQKYRIPYQHTGESYMIYGYTNDFSEIVVAGS